MKKIGLILASSILLLSACEKEALVVNLPEETPSVLEEDSSLAQEPTPESVDKSDLNNNYPTLNHILEQESKNMDVSMDENGYKQLNDPTSMTALINKTYYLPQDYIPTDLVVPDVRFSFDEMNEKKQLREEAARALEALFEAAEEDNIYLFAVSGYRSYQRQKSIYEWNLANKGEEHTKKYSAMPGHSEHQSGLAIDLSCQAIGFQLNETFESTPEGKWLAANASQFGYIIRYPKDKTAITGYAYEPWHIRYLGKELAQYLDENDLTLDEYYTQSN